jgi:beta-1,4-mannosyl-glycoprotein beta-1,4-N-acetylglucosaminyltransferase
MKDKKVYDCFTFFNELEILKIRLEEYFDLVDYFVLVESRYTHQNNPKPLFFNENKDKFSKYLTKIIHIIVEDKPIDFDPIRDKKWVLENFQRNCIGRGLLNCTSNDIIIVSDVDEIIDREVLSKALSNDFDKIAFGLKHYAYYLNSEIVKDKNYKYQFLSFFSKSYYYKYLKKKYWFGPVLSKYSEFDSPQSSRNIREELHLFDRLYLDAGWHFTYLGGVERIINKLDALNEEFDYSPYKNKEYLSERLRLKKDIFNPKISFRKDSSFKLPAELCKNLQDYKSFMI